MAEERRVTRRGPDNRDWYVVATAFGEAEAAIITGLLESADIPVWVCRESAGRALGLGMGILGTIEIVTPEQYYAEAMTLLEAGEVEAPPLGAGEDDRTVNGQVSPADEDDPPPA